MSEATSRHQRWQAARRRELAGPESWQGLVGLFWLESGDNAVGSAADAPVLLPEAVAHLGDLRWQGDEVSWRPVDGPPQLLQTDRDGQPSTVNAGRYAFFIVERQGRLAARVRDLRWAEKTAPLQLDYYPEDPAWRIEARWEALVPPLAMEVPNVSGELQTVEVSHRAVFEHAGATVSLLPMSVGDKEVFFVFRDRTSGRDTYGAGRFLKASPAVDGQIVLDFNFAYNPPCAFTPFATCPLPPPENWLAFPVPAGERKPVAG